MAERPYADARKFRGRLNLAASLPGIAAAALVMLYLWPLLQMDSEGWRALLSSLVVLTLALTPWGLWTQARMQRPIGEVIDRDVAGEADEDTLVEGYRLLTRLPVDYVRFQGLNWFLVALFVPMWLAWQTHETSAFLLGSVTAASLTAGFVVLPFIYYVVRSVCDPLRDDWAARISPDRRGGVVGRVPVRWKLAGPIGVITAATVVFSAMLAYVMAIGPLEVRDVEIKQAFLEDAVVRLRRGETLDDLRETARLLRVADDLLVLDAAAGRVIDGDAERLSPWETEWLARQPARGDSTTLSSPASFAWRRFDTDRLLVAATPIAGLTGAMGNVALVFGMLFLGTLGVAVLAALMVSRDVATTTRRLAGAARRITQGDLRGGEAVESEDELGTLGRDFERMATALRATVSRAAGAASRVGEAARELSEVGGAVASATVQQVEGIDRASESMGEIRQQVSGITDSVRQLTGNVEEASSSVHQMGVAAEELDQTASGLSDQVDAVSSSVDETVRSVAMIGQSNEGLVAAVTETSSSMTQMSRTMVEVNETAGETARLSQRVVDLSEDGREQVQRTIQGMEAIHEATDAAEQVIFGLAERMREIGMIVDVIDDVADETNLLALNAAIIAAQAGENGRSFSVVADEIKALADRVLTSTKEIGGLIQAAQRESASAAEAIERGSKSVQEGVDLSAQAGIALEQITGAAADSGQRIVEIVNAVKEQVGAAQHVSTLMERVSERVDEIRAAGREQERGNQVVLNGVEVMRDAARQTRRTTEEQAASSRRIRESIQGVGSSADHIHAALEEQSQACNAAATVLETVGESARSNDTSSQRLASASADLEREAEALHDEVSRFQTD